MSIKAFKNALNPDRKNPPFHQLEVRRDDLLLPAETFLLDNGLPVYLIPAPSSGLFRLDIVFPAGTWHEKHKLAAYFTNRMLREGTTTRDSNEIAECFDYYGAYLEDKTERDRAVISLYCPKRFASHVLPCLADIIGSPVFPDHLLEIEIQHQSQDFLINQERVSVLARQHFASAIFGPEHPYGKLIQIEDFQNIKRENLLSHYHSAYHATGIYLILAGDINPGLQNELNSSLGQWRPENRQIEAHPKRKHFTYTTRQEYIIPKEDAIQAAIRIGRPIFSRNHPDFIPMQLVVTLLGGYFGSRLMKNIREEKGYTYGISSSIQSMEKSGVFTIATEVGKDFIPQVLDEISFELNRLSQELVTIEELNMVRNYILGSLLRALDGPFAKAERFRTLVENGLKEDYFAQWTDKVFSIKPEEVMEISKKYLASNEMVRVIAG